MLSFEEQERIVRVGPGTEMGDLMRRYWHPIATSAQLPIPDSPPLLQRLLGQSLVVFRDTEGKVAGVPPSGVSLSPRGETRRA